MLETLTPLEGERRCFRLVGGVLVERTVGEVAPAVTRNREALEEVRSARRHAAPRARSAAQRGALIAADRAACRSLAAHRQAGGAA